MNGVSRIINLCPAINAVTMDPTVHSLEVENTILIQFQVLFLQNGLHITHMEWGITMMFPCLVALLQSSKGLMSLVFHVPPSHPGSQEGLEVPIALDHLTSLRLHLPFAGGHLAEIAHRWSMPSLRHVTFDYGVQHSAGLNAVTIFCSVHGRGLKYLHCRTSSAAAPV